MIPRPSGPAERFAAARRALEQGRFFRTAGAAALVAALDLAATGRFDDAARTLADIADGAPGTAAAGLLHGLALDAAGRRDEALAALEAGLADDAADYDCLCLAGEALAEWGAHDRAVEAYDRAIALAPHSSHAHLRRGLALAAGGEIDSAIRDMRRATLLQPDLADAHVALGDVLRTTGAAEEAIASYRHALALDPASDAAQYGLDAAIAAAVPGWHVAMLNDTRRNAAFEEAIGRAVRPGMHVLDIGTGSGLLAMMAARAGAGRVTACESVAPLAEAARAIVERNGFAGRIAVVHKRSTALVVGRDMQEPADLLVAEIVDCGLLSEGVLETLADARTRLLRPGGTVLPRAAAAFVVPVECPALDAEQRVDEVSGFALASFNALAPRLYRQLDLNAYDWRPLAPPVELFRFDFASAAPTPEALTVLAIPFADGTVHALAMWFRLEVDDHAVIATGPFYPPTHWKQAIFAVDPPVEVKQNEPVRIAARHDGRIVRLAFSGGR